ncbi:hypothetical protein [Sphaerisporangium perillae]|uniref:hypothetical protein n=1 Tax=Sphaerisporangium perillae TaxID=2935860 RepID=UPI00200EE01A|nr:hypothetical protein [Sphaerisporangium perillae]
MSTAELEERFTKIEQRLGTLEDQTIAVSYVAGEARKAAEGVGAYYQFLVADVKGIRSEQELQRLTLQRHSEILDGHTKRLDGLTATVEGHTKKLDEQSEKLDEQSEKLDEILRIVRKLS